LFLLLVSSIAFGGTVPINATSKIQPLHFIAASPSLIKPGKPNSFVSIFYNMLHRKKTKSIAAIAFGFFAVLLLAFIIFGAAYGGAAGGVVALIAVVGLGLIVFGIIKISKARKRKRNNS